jgi:hypothetical protein
MRGIYIWKLTRSLPLKALDPGVERLARRGLVDDGLVLLVFRVRRGLPSVHRLARLALLVAHRLAHDTRHGLLAGSKGDAALLSLYFQLGEGVVDGARDRLVQLHVRGGHDGHSLNERQGEGLFEDVGKVFAQLLVHFGLLWGAFGVPHGPNGGVERGRAGHPLFCVSFGV